MLTKQEKLDKRNDFLYSKAFGSDTYTTLFTFRQNTLGFLITTQFYDNLIEKIDDTSIFEHNLDNIQIIEVKQRILLDILTKIITISEGLFILVKSLNEGYASLPKNMINYRTSSVWNAIDSIRTKKYDLRKVLAFPDTKKLCLTDKEEEFLELMYADTTSKIYEHLSILCDFYEQYNIVYNKTKHGMTIYPIGFLKGKPKILENSSLTALDHREEKSHMPKGFFTTQIRSIENRWFNAKSHLNFNKKFLNELGVALQNLRALSDYVISNHLTFVNNCGEGYIPFKEVSKGKAGMWFYSDKMKDLQNTKLIISIQEKLFPNLVGSPFEFNMKENFEGTILHKIVPENSITNIWLQNDPLTKYPTDPLDHE